MEVKIQLNEKVITISELGLDLKIKPNYLIHQMMDEDGREMLKNTIYKLLDSNVKTLVEDFNHIKNLNKESKEDIREGKKSINSLKDFAVIVRQIIPLCFSFDMECYIESKSKEEREAIDWAYSIILYNSAYGYRKEIESTLNLQ